jgi:hypothetical protein
MKPVEKLKSALLSAQKDKEAWDAFKYSVGADNATIRRERIAAKKASDAIRKGDKFKTISGVWEVIAVRPFGKLELFNRDRVMFQDRCCREVRTWERIS